MPQQRGTKYFVTVEFNTVEELAYLRSNFPHRLLESGLDFEELEIGQGRNVRLEVDPKEAEKKVIYTFAIERQTPEQVGAELCKILAGRQFVVRI